MRLGIFAKTFPGSDPLSVFKAAKAAGYGTAQYNMACSGLPSLPESMPPGAAQAVAQAAQQAGVDIAALSATYNMIHPDPAVRVKGHASLDVLAASAREMGTRLLTLCTGTRNPYDQWRWHPDNAAPEAWKDLFASLEIAIGIADSHDVLLGIEPERANVVDSAAKARRLLDTVKSPQLKIVLDPANLVETEPAEERRDIVDRAVDLLAGDIIVAHAKDRALDGGFAAPGRGVIDFPRFFARLRSVGFEGPVIAHGVKPAEAPRVARFLADALDRSEDS